MREENLPKKVLDIVRSGVAYEQRKVDVHEFHQSKQVLKLTDDKNGAAGNETDFVVKR